MQRGWDQSHHAHHSTEWCGAPSFTLFRLSAFAPFTGLAHVRSDATTLPPDILGPIYLLNEPFIRAAYAGERQQFERRIPMPDGSGHRDSIATYAPDIQDGVVHGMFVHVADAGLLKAKELERGA